MKFKQLIKLYESEQAGPYVRTNSDLNTTTYYKYPNYTVRHRLGGPAYISGGYRAWYKDGLRHREDGPAIISPAGSEYWYQNDQLHRLGGPAYISGGCRAWYKDGLRHREDGPAIEYTSGAGEWYLHGKQLSPTEIEEQEQKIAIDKQIASDENNAISGLWSTL